MLFFIWEHIPNSKEAVEGPLIIVAEEAFYWVEGYNYFLYDFFLFFEVYLGMVSDKFMLLSPIIKYVF